MTPLIDALECASRLKQSSFVFIDTRSPEAFREGHIPGAVNVHEIFTHLSNSAPEDLVNLQTYFAKFFGDAGLSGKETAIIYEDAMNNGYGQSCRGYFLLRYLGYPDARVLHGGFQAWKQAALPISKEQSVPTSAIFPLKLNPQLMADKSEVLDCLTNKNAVLLDVRDREEWVGLSSSPYGVDFCPRKGRLPGAIWLEWYDVMRTQDGISRFKSEKEIEGLCQKIGIRKNQKIILYCFKGARASNTLLALNLAGYQNVSIYFGSWNEWSRDPALPIDSNILK